ncbi:MAG: cyclic nucleotide-binding domain-containing protein [Spirochaetaceae bacterium]|jgi:CRP-like cAMP-binding protein|nr:cyclic nucleotide-binding domain-containing protein [Spirochaetaceae bacterium]
MSDVTGFSILNFKKDMYILIEGKHDEKRFFIIREGHVKITKQVSLVKNDTDSVIGPGDFIGIVPAMAQRSQIESAQAITDVAVLAVHYTQFEGLIQNNTTIAMKIIQQFSRRIRYLNNALTGITSSSAAVETDTDVLFKTGEYYLKSKMNQQAYYVFKRYVECYPDGKFARQAAGCLETLKAFNEAPFKTGSDDFLRVYNKNKLVFADGEPGQSLYIIQKGSVRITKILDGNEIILAILKQGDIFGEMALLENKPRSASAIAQEDGTVLMEVLKMNFELIAKTKPTIINRLTQMLSERIWFSYKQLANALIKDPLGRIYDYMTIIFEKNNVKPSPTSFVFDFGLDELLKMAAVPAEQQKPVLAKLFNDKVIKPEKDKLFINHVDEIFKLGDYHKRMHRREVAQGRNNAQR